LLALLAGLVGETVTALPEDREFTEVEASLVGYLVRELFLEPMEKGWTEPDPPRLTAGVAGMPSVVWGVPGNEPALTGTLTVSAPFGEHTIHLLVPRSGRWERQSRIEVAAKPVEPAAREQIETLVREMAVDLTVVLGTADLTMLDLATLRAGDVVLLRQKVTQPLEGLVAGVQKFRVWPGTVGGRTAVRIDDAAADTMRYDTGAASSE
jgi:flagellar motor switch protein FliM